METQSCVGISPRFQKRLKKLQVSRTLDMMRLGLRIIRHARPMRLQRRKERGRVLRHGGEVGVGTPLHQDHCRVILTVQGRDEEGAHTVPRADLVDVSASVRERLNSLDLPLTGCKQKRRHSPRPADTYVPLRKLRMHYPKVLGIRPVNFRRHEAHRVRHHVLPGSHLSLYLYGLLDLSRGRPPGIPDDYRDALARRHDEALIGVHVAQHLAGLFLRAPTASPELGDRLPQSHGSRSVSDVTGDRVHDLSRHGRIRTACKQLRHRFGPSRCGGKHQRSLSSRHLPSIHIGSMFDQESDQLRTAASRGSREM